MKKSKISDLENESLKFLNPTFGESTVGKSVAVKKLLESIQSGDKKTKGQKS
jgi:hypothetical protein